MFRWDFAPPYRDQQQNDAPWLLRWTDTASSASNSKPPMAAMSEATPMSPMSTVTVRTTTTSTIFETRYAPGVQDAVTTSSSTTSTLSSSMSTTPPSSSSPRVPASSETRSASATPVLPPVVPFIPSPTPQAMPSSSQTQQSSASPMVPNGSVGDGPDRLDNKIAVIGGLSGAIAGLVLIGVLLCFCLRRRRRRSIEPEDLEVASEKGFRPILARKLTDMISPRPLIGTPPRPQPTKSPVIVDDHLIRMSLDHWERPYAYTEGLRESMGPGQLLRCTNPDPSRPDSPALPPPAHSPASFLKRQRSALTAVLLNANRSRTSPNSLAVPPPAITIDPALSQEGIPAAPAPSTRSSTSVVRSRTPEDPFLIPAPTPPHYQHNRTPPARPRLTPIQSASSTATRTLSNIGSTLLNPFRTRSDIKSDLRSDSFSRHSVTTFATDPSWRNRPHSDQFDLDRPSVRGSRLTHSGDWTGSQAGSLGKAESAVWTARVSAYEGT